MILKYIVLTICIVVFTSCGSSERVITDNGEVFEVKGDKFYKNGKEVTDALSDSRKDYISSVLERRLEVEEEAKKQQERIENELEKLKEKQKALKQRQAQIEDKTEEREAARENFFKVCVFIKFSGASSNKNMSHSQLF